MSRTATVIVTIENKLGLHARPATLFVETAKEFSSEISVRRVDHRETVDGKSILEMMMLAATQGTQLEITASGDDAECAIQNLQELVKGKFEEE